MNYLFDFFFFFHLDLAAFLAIIDRSLAESLLALADPPLSYHLDTQFWQGILTLGNVAKCLLILP